MKLIKTKKDICASKNYAKIGINNTNNSNVNYQNYKKCLKSIGENGFQRDAYDSNINYGSILHERDVLLERLKETSNHIKSERLNKLQNTGNDVYLEKTTPRLHEPKIIKLW